MRFEVGLLLLIGFGMVVIVVGGWWSPDPRLA
jgi:hypothetical protein